MKLSYYIKLRSRLNGCNVEQFECDKYLDCDSCLEDKIKEHDKQIRAEVVEFISDNLIYPLLDEYDRGLWERIKYIELAREWIKVLDDNPYPKVKNHTEAIKRDLRQWIAEQLKEQAD